MWAIILSSIRDYIVLSLNIFVTMIPDFFSFAELSENKTRLVAVQRKESQVQQASEGDVSVVHIETGANSAYGVLQKNFRV